MRYTFQTLLPADFEDLALDLVGRDAGVRFEAFATGPDGGMDGRHARGGSTTILQAKHYVGSGFPALKAAMRKERAAIDQLGPDRYILATSVPMTGKRKDELAAIIGSALRTSDDILGAEDLNALLRSWPEVETAHVKLWLSSAAVLGQIVNAGLQGFSAATRRDIEAKVEVYAQNPSFGAAQRILEDQHVLIVSGPPGVGKTTLGELLAFAHIGKGFNLIAIRSLDDGFTAIDDTRPQLFLFDDFLGRIALDARALSVRDSELARFMDRVRRSENARFILTTRAYILEEARRNSEALQDRRLDISKYVLDVGVYTRAIRARILYNHLLVAKTPLPWVQALIESGKLKTIVDHKNYNPRVIEWMTDALHIRDLEPETYPDAFLTALSRPDRLWDTAFRQHITDRCRHLLIALFFCSEFGVGIEDLRVAYEPLHRAFCERFGQPRDPKDFEEALRILEGGFITLQRGQVAMVNPSLRDYLTGYMRDDAILLVCAEASQTVAWSERVWRFSAPENPFEERPAGLAAAFLPIARRFPVLPVCRTRDGMQSRIDSGGAARIALLLDWWVFAKDGAFADLAMEIAGRQAGGGQGNSFTSWTDAEELIDLIRQLKDGGYYPEFRSAEELVQHLEAALTQTFWIAATDELPGLADLVDSNEAVLSTEVTAAFWHSVQQEIESVGADVQTHDSESALEDHIQMVITLGKRAGVSDLDQARALEKLQNRLDMVSDQSETVSGPRLAPTRPEAVVFDDAALESLFRPLLDG